jgi:hypothetical protein
MRSKYVIALFFVFLVVSLTPASALSIVGTNDKAVDNNNPSTDNIQEQMDQIQPQIAILKGESNSLIAKLNRLKCIWYKPWCWGEASVLLKEMGTIIIQIRTTSNKLKGISEKLRSDSEKLYAEVQNSYKTIDSTPNHIEDAKLMSKKLEERLKVAFTTTPANGLMVGDVVQYKSQNKYYRYLRVLRMEENEDFVVLEGTGKNITVNKAQLSDLIVLKLIPSEPINGTKVVSTANQIQVEMIGDMINTAAKMEEKAKKLKTIATSLQAVSVVLFIVSGCLVGAGMYMSYIFVAEPAALVTILIALGVAGTGLMMAGTGICLDKLAESLLKKASELRKAAAAALEDLNRYRISVSHVPVAQNMTLNTTINHQIKTSFNAKDPDGDKLKASIVTQPENGTLWVSKDFNTTSIFIYTPSKNFTGNDSFTYKVFDENGLISNIATVTITVLYNHSPVAQNAILNTKKDQPIQGIFKTQTMDGNILTPISANKHRDITLGTGLEFLYVSSDQKDLKWKNNNFNQVLGSKGGLSNIAW